jgi:hypothetical protein
MAKTAKRKAKDGARNARTAKKSAAARPKEARRRQRVRKAAKSSRRITAPKPSRRAATARSEAKAPRSKSSRGASPKGAQPKVASPARARAARQGKAKSPRLDRVRRTLEEIIPTPPSSLNLNRRGSAVRTGRAEMAESLADHASMTPAITGGDVDADLEAAYFSGDEAPGGDNSTPDQDVVEEIGKALGIEYQDNEELRGSDKVAERDKHRWELDPASSEDYRERKK